MERKRRVKEGRSDKGRMESRGEEMATEWKNNGEGERSAKIEYVIGEILETERKRIARDERASWEVRLEG